MKPRYQPVRHLSDLFTICLALAGTAISPSAFGTAYTWDGGDNSSPSWSTPANWSTDVAPAATGDTLTFAGTNNLNAANNLVTSLATSGTAVTFASGAGSFDLSGNTITMGSGGGGGQVIIQQNSTSNQTISANINLTGGSGDRSIVFASGAGSLTLSGNINFSNDWLFPTTTAGTIILSGNNTGDGKAYNAGGITAGTNKMNAMMRNNVAGTQLVLGSDTALGNSGSGSASAGTADFRGIVANQQLNISTAGGDRNLSGSSLAINANNITFNGTNNLAIGNIVNVGGNRDLNVSSTGKVTAGTGLYLSSDQTGRQLYMNLSGAGGMTISGKLYDTFHSSGLTTAGSSILRKAGTGTLELNGDSGTTFGSVIQIEAGTLKIGHANALGATGATGITKLQGGTLDLNGQIIGETLSVTSNSTLINSSTTAAVISADATLTANLSVNTTGNITITRLIGSAAVRTITKLGNGTLTTNGSSHNNLAAWDIQAGKVVFANTSGYGADRSVTLNGGTLQLSGSNSDLINNGETFTINSGTFDLNGKAEAVASIGGTGGTMTNSAASTTSTLYVGGGPSGTSSASFAGVIENGAGTMKLAKEGTGTQTLTGTNTYTGATTITAGTLTLGSGGSISNSSSIVVNGILDTSAKTSFTIGSSQTLGGGGTVNVGSGNALAINGTLSPGNSPGVLTVSGGTTTLNSGSIFAWELNDNKDSTTGTRGTNYDGLTTTNGGNLTVGSGAVFKVILTGAVDGGNAFWNTTRSWTNIFNVAGTTTPAGVNLFDTIQVLDGTTGSLFTPVNGSFTFTGSTLTWSAVPEPSGMVAGLLLGSALLRRRRD
ncbi:MAG: autotransporter-associated beta strand repeat-containing protein [Luteolibacter sp.]